MDYRRSLPPGTVAPISPTSKVADLNSSSPSASPVRRSTKSSGSSISEKESSSSSSKQALERPPSRSGDSSARERLAEQKADKYKVLADEAKADAARTRTKLEDTEKELKVLKKALEEAKCDSTLVLRCM